MIMGCWLVVFFTLKWLNEIIGTSTVYSSSNSTIIRIHTDHLHAFNLKLITEFNARTKVPRRRRRWKQTITKTFKQNSVNQLFRRKWKHFVRNHSALHKSNWSAVHHHHLYTTMWVSSNTRLNCSFLFENRWIISFVCNSILLFDFFTTLGFHAISFHFA